MKVSQLREYLAEVQEDHGDIDVKFPSMIDAESDESDTVAAEGVSILLDENERPAYLLICDQATLDAFTSDEVIE